QTPQLTVAVNGATSTSAPHGAQPGDLLEYTLTLVNSGAAAATGVTVNVSAPPYTKGLRVESRGDPSASLSVSSSGGANATGVFSISNITVPANFSLQVVWAVTAYTQSDFAAAGVSAGQINGKLLPELAAQSIGGTGTIPSDDPAVGGAADPTTVVMQFTAFPDFTTSTKSVTDVQGRPNNAVKPGDQLLYTITVNNTGVSPATNVTVTDTLDANLLYDAGSASGGGTLSGNTLTWTLPGSLAAGSSATLQFSAHLAAAIANGTRIDNAGQVTSSEITAAQKTSTATVIVASTGSLSSSTKAFAIEAPGTALPGRKVTYTFSISDTGDSTADDVVVTDPLAACLTNPVPGQGGLVSGNIVTWNKSTTPALAKIAPGAPVTLTLDATVNPAATAGTVCDNVGQLSASDVPSTTTSHATFTIVSQPELGKSTKAVAIKTDANGDGLFSPGDRVAYTIVVQNTGNSAASDVILTDSVPSQLVNVTTVPGNTPGPGGALQWNLGALAAGAQTTVTIEGDLATGAADQSQVCNQGSLTTPELASPATTVNPDATAAGAPKTCFKVSNRPDLSAFTKKLEGGSPRHPGETLTYTLTVPNKGTQAASGVAITDPIDRRFTFVSATASDGGAATFNAGASALAVAWPTTLNPGAQFTVSLQLKLQAVLDNGTQIPNQATVNAISGSGTTVQVLSDDPATPAAHDPTIVTIVSAPNLSTSTKTVAAAPGNPPHTTAGIHPGDTVRYTISIANTGDADAKSVVVTDPVDARLTPVTPIANGGTFANGVITWTLPTAIHPGDPATTLTFDALVAKPLANGTTIDNQGSIAATGLTTPQLTDDPTRPGATDPTRITIVAAADLSTSSKAFTNQTHTDGTIHPGDTILFTITPKNTGDAETTQTTVADVLDPNLTFVSATQGGTFDAPSRTVTWTLTKLPLGAGTPLTFTATIAKPLADGTQIKNSALLNSAEIAPGVRTNEVVLLVKSAPDLSTISKVALDASGQPITAPVPPGTVITWAINVTNAGDAQATNVSVSDAVPAGLDTITPLDGGTLSGTTITWTPGTLTPSGSVLLRFTSRVPPLTADATTYANQAQVTSSEITTPQLSDDPSTAAAKDPTVVKVTAKPDLSTTTKTVTVQNQSAPGVLRPGDTLSWTITVVNTGNTVARNVVVKDPIDPQLTNVAASQGGQVAGGFVTWTSAQVPQFGSLAPGANNAVTLAFTAQVNAGAHDGDVISNQAQLTSDEGLVFVTDDPSTAAAKDPTRITVHFADVRLDKTVKAVTPRADGTIHPNDLVDYTIVVTNRGSGTATNVTVGDVIDTHLSNLIPTQGGQLTPAAGGNPARIDWTGATTPALQSLGQAATVTLGFRATVAALTRDGTVVSNQAQLKATELAVPVLSDDPNTPAAADATTFTVRA
ncbi:MAG: DUF11 domain-containing protein, partial [Deltaproteobacteria bacterium]|nr:DUF11 domain-containing protein [Deltaproteobacteria bacterium]